MAKSKKTETFTESYQQLNEIAEALRSSTQPNIDALVPMVEKATKAYQQCQQRIQAVQAALKEHFAQDGQDVDSQSEPPAET